jgi:hypothetical protein
MTRQDKRIQIKASKIKEDQIRQGTQKMARASRFISITT